MRTRSSVYFWGSVLLAALAIAVCSEAAQAQSRLPSPLISVAGQHITLAGTLKRVEAGPHAALFAGDDGRQYVLDLSQAKIVLPSSSHLPLLPGMRGTVSGLGNSDGSIAVTRFQAVPNAIAPAPIVAAAEPPDLTIRGTVEAVDLERGAFVLRVNTHTRVVYVTADTNVSQLGSAVGFPVQPGQRMTVGGSLQPDGSVLAGLLTAKEDVDYHTAVSLPNRILFGMVSYPANKLGHRDIKVRSADGSTEAKVVVPRDIPVRRSGAQISVYDLSRRDSVRVTGRTAGTDFRAARIDVLAPTPDAAQAVLPAPPSRPGL